MAQEEAPGKKSIGNVLVVGGCGFLGSATVDHILNFPSEATSGLSATTPTAKYPSLKSRYPNYDLKGTTVHVLDLRCNKNTYDGCTYHEADITNIAQVLKVFRAVKPDVVINTASPSFEAPKEVLKKVNVEGTRILVEVAGGKHGDWGGRCKVFVHTSSSSVISDGYSDLKNADERWPYVCPNPREFYSETKVYAEQIVLNANNQLELGNMLTSSVRPAGIVGEGDMGGFSYGILKTASAAPPWQLHMQLGDNTNLFDNTYVHNVVYGLLCVADALLETQARKQAGRPEVLDTERVDGEAFIVTNDEPGYFWDTTRYLYNGYTGTIDSTQIRVVPEGFASVIGAMSELFDFLTGRKGKITRQTVKYSCMNRYFNCQKLKTRTRYTPIVDLEEALSRSVVSYKEHERQEKNKKGQ